MKKGQAFLGRALMERWTLTYRNKPTTHHYYYYKDAIASRNTTIFLDKAGKAKAQAEEFEPSEAKKE